MAWGIVAACNYPRDRSLVESDTFVFIRIVCLQRCCALRVEVCVFVFCVLYVFHDALRCEDYTASVVDE